MFEKMPKEGPVTAENTKTKILDVAEKLFAENGLQATSLRQIINEAGVNVASVHYHFGSKDVVVREILARRLGPMNEKKMQRLAELENKFGANPIPLEALVSAFVEPHIHMDDCDREQMKLVFKLIGELENVIGKVDLPENNLFVTVFEGYLAAFHKTLPDISEAELKWRFKFMLGAPHSVMMQQSLPKNFPLRDDETNAEQIVDYLVSFLTAGFLAPATDTYKRKDV